MLKELDDGDASTPTETDQRIFTAGLSLYVIFLFLDVAWAFHCATSFLGLFGTMGGLKPPSDMTSLLPFSLQRIQLQSSIY